MDLIATIRESWSWAGLEPTAVVGDNPFGNLIVKDNMGQYWRICPEELSCKVVAQNRPELDALSHDQKFLHDWYMSDLVESANQLLGPLRPGYKYGLKIPGMLGGEYGGTNLAILSLRELISASGYMAQQIQGLPELSLIHI